ncbi:MAG: carbonic anhydrase, partial [Polynucleobacter sp. 32-46-5]
MCTLCNAKKINGPSQSLNDPIRRTVLRSAGLLSIGGLIASAGVAFAQPANPPKSENVLNPDQALSRLMAGNAVYVKSKSLQINVDETRGALARGQNPYACILSCADSRISPELAFNEERGDLFVARVAGNFVNTDILASLEYGTAVLGAQLIMVLGHTSCGAIDASIKAYTQNASFPGHIQALTTALAPAVREASKKSKGKDLINAATIENVRLNVE